MQKVHIPISENIFKTKIINYLKSIITIDIDNAFKIVPKSFFTMNTIGYKIFIVLFSIFIIPILVHFFLRWKQKKIILSCFDIDSIYKKALTQIDELELIKAEKRNDAYNLKKYRVSSIPGDAIIVKKSELFTIKLLNKYECKMRTGRARWIRNYGRSTQVYYKNTGYILFNLDTKRMEKFKYSLSNHHALFGKKMKLENDAFNKKLNYVANDSVLARVIYTPLASEETLKLNKNLKLSWWNVSMENNFVKIIFQPRKTWNIFSADIRFYSDKEKIIDFILSDISNNIYLIYKLFNLVLIPVLL